VVRFSSGLPGDFRNQTPTLPNLTMAHLLIRTAINKKQHQVTEHFSLLISGQRS
jgi:hypothetical protein